MKLHTAHTPTEPRPKAAGLLNPELPAEPTLNEKIGLSPKLERIFRSKLEFRTNDFAVDVSQVETAVHLITLFPAEENNFIQQAPIDRLIPLLKAELLNTIRVGTSAKVISALYHLSFLAPGKVPALPPREVIDMLIKIRSAGNDDGLYLKWGAEAIRLFPNQAATIRNETKGKKDGVLRDYDGISIALFRAIKRALEIDPALHAELRTYTLQHRGAIKQFFKEAGRAWEQIPAEDVAGMLASYKLLLADEITVSPSGILLAVERPRVGKVAPLPERSLTP